MPRTTAQTIVQTIGPGADHPTLAAWADALPLDLVASGLHMVAELTAARDDPGGAVIRARCDETCFLTLRAAPGHGFAELTDPTTDALAPTGFGATIRAEHGTALSIHAGARVALSGLQVVAEDGPAVADDGEGACIALDGCVIEAVSAEPAATLRGVDAIAASTALIQRGTGDGLCLADGAAATGCTIFKPARDIASGIGISATGAPAPVTSSVAFGFAQAFGAGIGPALALVSDQTNALADPDRLDHPSWSPVAVNVDISDTRPGPFGVSLQRLTATGDEDAFLEALPIGALRPGERAGFAVIVGEPTALTSAIALRSSVGMAELRVSWIDTPPSFALMGKTGGLAAVDGGVSALGGGLYRLWLDVVNQSSAEIWPVPRLYAARGFENAGLAVGLHAGAAMAAPGHIGQGFCKPDALGGARAVDPRTAIMNASSVLPDLRPVEGGPLDGAGLPGNRDILGRGRLIPDTAGAFTLNPAPRFLGEAILRPEGRRSKMKMPPSLEGRTLPHLTAS